MYASVEEAVVSLAKSSQQPPFVHAPHTDGFIDKCECGGTVTPNAHQTSGATGLNGMVCSGVFWSQAWCQ